MSFEFNIFSPLIFCGVAPSLDSCVANLVAVELYVCKLRVWGLPRGILKFRHCGMLTVRSGQRSPTGSCDDEIIHTFLINVQHKWSLNNK